MLSLIVNPHAGNGRAGRELPKVETELRRLGLAFHTERTRSIEHARELARAAVSADETAVALGGDGLIGAVADELKHTDAVLGVLPGGRGNDFARTLGVGLDPVAACSVLAGGAVRPLDLGEVAGRTYIGIASCGFDSVANRIANESKLIRGNLVYAYGAIRALITWKPATFEVRLDGGLPRTVRGYSIAAANSKAYGGGMLLAPHAELGDGMLDVVMISHAPKLRFLRLLPTVFKAEHVREPNVEIVRAREVEISAERAFTVFADGDPIAELPARIRALPAAVRVLVPA